MIGEKRYVSACDKKEKYSCEYKFKFELSRDYHMFLKDTGTAYQLGS